MSELAKTKIVFMGTSSFAAEILGGLLGEKYSIQVVFTQKSKKSEDESESLGGPVEKLAKEAELEIFSPESFGDEEVNLLEKINPEVVIVAAYGKILPKKILQIPPFGCLNIHASLLPRHRGPSPIQNSLLEGENETGVTIMLMDEGIDTGDIVSFQKIPVDKNEVFPDLCQKLSTLGKDLLIKDLPLFLEGKIKAVAQNNSLATLCQLIEKEDGKIFWNDEAINIYNRYRAFYSWPGIYCFWERNDKKIRIKLRKIEFSKKETDKNFHFGQVFLQEDELCVKAEKGVIILKEIQLEGKNPIAPADFINGYPDIIGAVLK